MIRWLWRAPVLALLAYLGAGTLGGIPLRGFDTGAVEARHHILLVKGPIHSDIAVPVTAEDLDRFEGLGDHVPLRNAGYVLFGWGARDFYTTTGTYADLELGPIWRAVRGDASVMRVDVIPSGWTPQDVSRVPLTADQYDRLFRAIRSGFSEPITPLAHPGFTDTDVFFDGAGRFHLFRTCNVWVGEVLAAAGVRVGPWTPFTWSLP